MSETMNVAASGALVQQMRLEVLSNNLSNINTIGFKEDRSVFSAYLPGSPEPIKGISEMALVSGNQGSLNRYLPSNFHVEFEGTKTSFSPGQLKHTGNELDLALDGNGFFCVKTPEGVQYTRKGNFSLNKDGVLATHEGLPVLGNGGEIKIDGQNIVIDIEGNLSVDGKQVDTIKIVDFSHPYALEKIGDTLFTPINPGVTEEIADRVQVSQGFVELSNVDAVKVMTEMIEVLRAYESYQKVIRCVDEITSKAINEVGTLA
jgi:flagellar basal-body rod protein FlgF